MADGFNDDDRRSAIETENRLREMEDRLTALQETVERGQRVSLRRLRRLPDLTATAMLKGLGRRALLLIGIGIALGSMLGGAGIAVAQKIIAWAVK